MVKKKVKLFNLPFCNLRILFHQNNVDFHYVEKYLNNLNLIEWKDTSTFWGIRTILYFDLHKDPVSVFITKLYI